MIICDCGVEVDGPLLYGMKEGITVSEVESVERAYISEDDEESLSIYQHLAVSQRYHSRELKMHNIITIKHTIITNETSLNDICEAIENVSILISACKTEIGQQLVMNMSQSSGIPTVHLLRSDWNALLENNTDKTPQNQIFLIPTVTVFDNVILDVLPSLNLSRNVSVLFDLTYGNLENLRKVFGMLPICANFFQLQTTSNKLQEQLKYVAGIGRVIIIAKTANAVMVAKEVRTSIGICYALRIGLLQKNNDWTLPFFSSF
ncbi:unnamed protein product [Cylicocyclus nassatus]|uniref:Uncharacterized protein n=1 Tax=Cylicocyclus nassatus TaxID=53992 RepID=A0AA36MBK9_CYLNA|nr:unnamed protein product [Cylicocyclus nassatus]